MNDAIKFVEKSNQLMETLLQSNTTVQHIVGRRFDRFSVNGNVKFFVDRASWEIYGAKSSFQFNPRRWYGTLDSVTQYDWSGNVPVPIAGTPAERIFNEREEEITKQYKPRGRPRKNAGNP
jgi:hypothetical protein